VQRSRRFLSAPVSFQFSGRPLSASRWCGALRMEIAFAIELPHSRLWQVSFSLQNLDEHVQKFMKQFVIRPLRGTNGRQASENIPYAWPIGDTTVRIFPTRVQ
jgi:hypothetical protein